MGESNRDLCVCYAAVALLYFCIATRAYPSFDDDPVIVYIYTFVTAENFKSIACLPAFLSGLYFSEMQLKMDSG